MAQNLAPGVYVKIVDLSTYVQNVPSTIGFMSVITEMGPDNQLLKTNRRDFYLDYGDPNITYSNAAYGQGPYIASSFLDQSDSFYIIRALPDGIDVLDNDGLPTGVVAFAKYSNLALIGIVDTNPSPVGVIPLDSTANIEAVIYSGLKSKSEIEAQLLSTSPLSVGASAEEEVTFCIFYGIGRGEYYDNFQIRLTRHANPYAKGVYILDIYRRQKADDVNDEGQLVPSYGIIETFMVSFNPTALDESGKTMFIEDVVNKYSRYIRIACNSQYCKLKAEVYDLEWDTYLATRNAIIQDIRDAIAEGDAVAEAAARAALAALVEPSFFDAPFVDGAISMGEGSTDLFDEAGFRNGVAKSCLIKAYSGTITNPLTDEPEEGPLNVEDIYFSLVFDGGYPTDVKMWIVNLVKTRGDCVAILDNGDNATAAAALLERQDSNPYNTRYAALYEAYSKVYDTFTGRDIWLSPVYHMANIIPFTDNTTEIWYAAAGFNRATIASIKELRYSPNLGQRDDFYLNQLNPIVKFNVGYTVFSQLTTQRRPSALQDINIIRTVLYIKRALEQYCRFYIFEFNDEETWTSVSQDISKFLKQVQNKRGLTSFTVNVSADEYQIQAKEFQVDITLVPKRVVERIYLNFYVK